MENKKTKLTISGNPKKSFKKFDTNKSQGKKTVIIDNQKSRNINKGSFHKQPLFKSNPPGQKKEKNFKPGFSPKMYSAATDFERRKLAEQRATKRLKEDTEGKERKSKSGTKKREVKLTVSRALSDEIETRERSLASVKRARQKELKNANKQKIKKV